MRLAILLLCAIAASAADVAPAALDPTVAGLFGPGAEDVVREATSVTVFRVEPLPAKSGGRTIDGRLVTAQAAGDARAVDELRAILFDARTYDFDNAKSCEFMPGVVFRLARGDAVVDVLVCFHCNELEILTYAAGGGVARRGHEDCDAARARLLALAKRAFPDDAELAALK